MENSLWQGMVAENNVTVTENNAKAYVSTLNDLIDFAFKASSLRKSDPNTIRNAFIKAYNNNPVYAVRLAFYLRDVRGGQGERNVFRVCMDALSFMNIEYFKKVVEFIPEYGRWDDLIYCLDKHTEEIIIPIIQKQLNQDIANMNVQKPISLLAKWMPSENTSSPKTVQQAKKLRKHLNMNSKEYRHTLTALRKYLDVTEVKMCSNSWDKLNYNIIPSLAMMRYKSCFYKHDSKRFEEYCNSLSKGETKINASVLYPFDIIKNLNNICPFLIYDNINVGQNELAIAEAQWKGLPDFFKGKFDNALVVADTSGSMFGNPICACLGLALYIGERNKGLFHNKFITFSEKPELQEIVGTNLVEKLNNLKSAAWMGTTNIDKVFQLILNTAVNCRLTKADMPSMIYIISDMQFDECVKSNYTNFEFWKTNFNQAGYELPTICFWNVSEHSYDNVPVTIHQTGAVLCCGYSPAVCKYIMESDDLTDTMQLILNIVNSKRYKNILADVL